MKHPTIDRLHAHLEDRLSERERAGLDAHLAGCPECRARLSEYSALITSLRRLVAQGPAEAHTSSEPPPPVAPVESTAVVANAPAVPSRQGWTRFFSANGFSLVLTITVLLVVLGMVWTRFQGRAADARAVREPVSPDEFVPDWAAPAPDLDLAQSPAPAPARVERVPPLPAASLPAAARALLREVPRMTPHPGEAVAGMPASARPAAGAWDRATPLDGGTPVGPPDPSPVAASVVAPATSDPAAGTPDPGSTPALRGATTEFAPPLTPSPAVADPGTPPAAEIVPPCGTLADPRGNPIAGAHVIALGSDARAARSGADGRFCFPVLRLGDTLHVWRAGFHPTRLVVDSENMLSLRMAPIAVPSNPATSPKPNPNPNAEARRATLVPSPPQTAPARESIAAPRPPVQAPARGERSDVYANESHSIRVAVAEARIATARARDENTARAYERAADRWETIALRTSGKAMVDARFQSIVALRAAYRLSPTWNRLSHLRGRLARFVATAPKAIPERITAVNWRAELGTQR